MARVTWNETILAESDDFEFIEGNIYFPPQSVKKEFLKKSPTPYTCPWKGKCQYYSIVVKGIENKDAAWAYHNPKEVAKNIKDYVAFDKKKVEIKE